MKNLNKNEKKLVSVIIVTKDRKKEVLQCLESVFSQTYKPLEVILVDNASTDDTLDVVSKRYPKTIIISSPKNTGGAGGRNLGINKASGKFLLFMDDDAKADTEMIKELMAVLDKNNDIGIVQPKIYFKERKQILQGVGHGINLLTGRVYGLGVGEVDQGQYDKNMEIPLAGCTWIVKKDVVDKIGKYDEDYFIPYEDSDFSQRARKAGYRVFLAWKARVWHRGPKNSGITPKLQWIGITTPERAFRTSRNKIIFMRKHAPFFNFIFFLFILVPLYTLAHSLIMVNSKRGDILLDYWKGLFSGFRYIFK